jgi:hypothetical protein
MDPIQADLRAQVAGRYVEVNGEHPMTSEDDAYVDEHFVTVEALAAQHGLQGDEIRQLILDRVLPLPSYLRSDGEQMVPSDLLALAEAAGSPQKLPSWFVAQFDDPATAEDEWESYLSGGYVCLKHVTPATIRRKDELCDAITQLLDDPQPGSPDWLTSLHDLVDQLDAIEPPFAPYDRLRFGGPVSRDRLITETRRAFPRPLSPSR